MRQGDVALHEVEQLPHIAGPVGGCQQFDRLGRVNLLLAAGFRGLLEEMRNQQWNVLAAAAQRRHFNRQNVDLVIQIFEKRSAVGQWLEVAGSGADQPDVRACRAQAPCRGNVLAGERFHERNLQLDGQIADFDQQQCAAARPVQCPFAGFAAEKLGLQIVDRTVLAGHHDERPFAPHARRVDGARKQLFSGTVLAGQQDRHAAGCGSIGNPQPVFHELISRQQIRAPIRLGRRKSRVRGRSLHLAQQLVLADRLDQVAECAALSRLHGLGNGAVAREDYYGQLRPPALQFFQEG